MVLPRFQMEVLDGLGALYLTEYLVKDVAEFVCDVSGLAADT